MKKGILLRQAVLGCIALGCGLLAVPSMAQVQSPWVTTDRTVDCSSYETILAGVLKPGMTDEQKALALYDFYRQMVYHYQNIAESRNPVKCINAIGNTLCGSQATCMRGLLEAAGIKARCVSHPGHTFYEAFYGGKWHGYDTMTNFYVFTRGPDRHVASFEELHKDPTLIKDAEKEGRAVPGMCCCGDEPMAFAQRTQVTDYQPDKSDWSVKDYSLRPGEQIVRSWWPQGKPLPGTYRTGADPGPMHGCGKRDQGNPPELFRFWEPYGIAKMGGKTISYRHYFNGTMSYSPDPAARPCKDALAKGELVVPVKCPFYVTAATAALEATCPTAGDAVEVSVTVDKHWTPILTAADRGTKQYRAELDKVVVRSNAGRHTYELKFKIVGKATLDHFHLQTVFTHNAMAAPHLMPGKNQITLTVANSRAVKADPLTLVYRYKEAPDWKVEKVIEKTASQCPLTFAVDLPETAKLPQMQDLTLRCGRLSWAPK
jgi:hypothetical protein